MSIHVYMNFNGNCTEAVNFYADVFSTEKPEISTYGQASPNPEYPLPDEAKNLVMHARIKISGTTIMFSDVFPGMDFSIGNNINLTFVTNNMDEIQSVYTNLQENGSVEMELQETFWSKCYGKVTDQFGITWQLSHEEE